MTRLSKGDVVAKISQIGLVPVIRARTADLAMRAADAIRQGGIPILEITMTVPGAVELIAAVKKRFGDDVIVGAGTVLDAEKARACVAAGAQFVVSPAFDAATVEYCAGAGVASMPGALTPTEIVTAWNAGAALVKVFPVSALGGAKYIRSLRAPLPDVPLVPTGGVSLANAAEFISAGATAVGVGAELVDTAALVEGRDAEITERARQLVEIVRKARDGKAQLFAAW
jgi:2-dehydro-3-deoxyphosphogluconate aldolase / (4S)-4-hydroxy-2-oxoglutarate aldolase